MSETQLTRDTLLSVQVLAEVALKCFCELLVSLPHFNFVNNIIASLVPLLPSKAMNGTVRLTMHYYCTGAPESVNCGCELWHLNL